MTFAQSWAGIFQCYGWCSFLVWNLPLH